MPQGAGDKTEKATPKRLDEARKKGQIAKSPDLNGALVLLVGLFVLGSATSGMIAHVRDAMMSSLDQLAHPEVVSGAVGREVRAGAQRVDRLIRKPTLRQFLGDRGQGTVPLIAFSERPGQRAPGCEPNATSAPVTAATVISHSANRRMCATTERGFCPNRHAKAEAAAALKRRCKPMNTCQVHYRVFRLSTMSR